MSGASEASASGKKASYWKREGKDIRCFLCPHKCLIVEGKTGLCKVRKHISGQELVSLSYGLFSSIAVDPVEKKPLYHWHPGSKILSLGSVGCNMSCPFCQNWHISVWERDVDLVSLDPTQIVELAQTHGLESVAFTYNEPLVGYEYLCDACRILKNAGLNVVLVSNGLICREPLMKLIPFVDAVNIDLKTFTDEGYRVLGGNLDTVKSTICTMSDNGVHVEITHLIVPRLNEDPVSFQSMIDWICGISEDMVLHLSRYFPNFKWTEPPTAMDLMEKCEETAMASLNYVYIGNVYGESVTHCKKCGREIIVRNGYSVSLCKIDASGKCCYCGADNNIEI